MLILPSCCEGLTLPVCAQSLQSCLFVTLWTVALLCPWNSPGKNPGVDCYALLQGIFPTQGSNPGLPHCRQIPYQLSHKGFVKAEGLAKEDW